MTVCLSVKTDMSTSTFQYLGDEPELWKTAVQRVLVDPVIKKPVAQVRCENSESWLDSKTLRKIRSRVQYPTFFIELEKVVRQVSLSQWNDLSLQYFRNNGFVTAVRYVWTVLKEKLTLESAILDTLYQNGNGGLKVESIMGRLLTAHVVCRFSALRDALGHLCKLCLVEHAHGQFSIRQGMIKR